jgi:hypothetical protein
MGVVTVPPSRGPQARVGPILAESAIPRMQPSGQPREARSAADRGPTTLAISLWQPWASLWVCGRKVHETRHWHTAHRGWLIVHAASRIEKLPIPAGPLGDILNDQFGHRSPSDFPRGALVGRVRIVDCSPTRSLFADVAASEDDRVCGDFAEGRFAWRADGFQAFKEPIPYRGSQGFFRIPQAILSELKV